MSRLGGLPGRRKKSFNFFDGRIIAIVGVLAVAALSFTLGYYAGSSGSAEMVSETLKVPEGAGMVVLADGKACDDGDGSEGSKPVGASTGAVLETMSPLIPTPDGGQSVAQNDEESPTLPRKPVSELELARTSAKKTEPGTVSAAPTDIKPDTKKTVAKKTQEIKKPEPKAAPKPKPAPKQTVVKKSVPKKKTSTRVTVKPAAEGKTYSVQVGAFKTLGDAQTHKRRFTTKGYKASVYPDKGKAGQTIYKVRIGTFFDRQSADVMARKLKDEWGASAFVTTIR